MNDPAIFLFFPISTSAGYNIFFCHCTLPFMDISIVLFYCMYISNMIKTMNNDKVDYNDTGRYNTLTITL